jgi:antirestriction protein ArdC
MFYRKVTDAIINAIKAGVGNWKMPWHTVEVYVYCN